MNRSRILQKSLTSAAFLFAALPGCQQDETTAEPFEILFVGDTNFGETYQVHRRLNILKWKGYDHSLKKLKPILLDSDFVIANLETPITDVRESPLEGKKPFIHKGHVEKTPRTLRQHNIKTVSLANNHTMDHGLEGLKQTLEVLRENGMTAMGAALTAAEAARPYVEEFRIGARVFKLAVIAGFEYSEVYDRDHRFYAEHDRGGVNALSHGTIKRQIQELKRDDAFVVVFPHWGENYEWKTEPQTEFAHKLIEAGADLIVGHGAHMMQEIEKYEGRWIVYNLGNFMFNSQGRYQVLNVAPFSLAAQLRLDANDDGWLKTVRLYPIVTDNHVTGYQSRFLRNDEFSRARKLLLGKSPNSKALSEEMKTGQDGIGPFFELTLE